jgi:hypothetical protein
MPAMSGTLTVSGDDPRHAVSPTFANFLAVSHVGSEVQFEFIFLDLNQLALRIQRVKEGVEKPDGELQGKTVAKLVMPTAAFIQLKEHLAAMFERLEVKHEPESPEKTGQERGYAQ